jgi:hypothetical protein
MDLGRGVRSARKWLEQRLRPKVLVALGLIIVLAGVLLWRSFGIPQYGENLALNLGADLIGAIVVIFVISPLITRAQHGRVREHRRLDYDWFTDQVMHATSDVRVLDTFSGLLDRPGTARFLRAVRDALARHAYVKILLIDPDSLAAAQRASELGNDKHADVRREVMRNLKVLERFTRELDERVRSRFEVRLYSASAAVTLYRWDDRALVSFLPIGRLSGDGTQLEITTGSPLGTFVGERFDELWSHGKPLARFIALAFTLTDGRGPARPYNTPFVRVGDHYFVTDPQVLAELALSRDGGLRATLDYHPTLSYELDVLIGESDLHSSVIAHYEEKYERPGRAFVRLRPAPAPAADERTPPSTQEST